jgi:ABC-type polysaccharide/polyol phosphate transport system ATPase subunit
MNAIDVVHVSKVYRRHSHRHQLTTLKSALLSGNALRGLRPDETFPALHDVSFTVSKGAAYGIVGRNGSGKSTALKLLAGITKPTSGTVHVEGRISALIELGAGFHPEISGRENVFINGIMLGLSKREIARRFDEIVEFAELEEFIDAPVKTYSSGMYMRLGFAVAIHVDPDVLLIDEVLAVGDEGFTHKCLDKFADYKRRGKTIVLVTHSLGLVARFCDEAIWLDHGRVSATGDPKRVIDTYVIDVAQAEEADLANSHLKASQRAASTPQGVSADGAGKGMADGSLTPGDAAERELVRDGTSAPEGRWGSREVEITGVTLLNAAGEVAHLFETGEPLEIRLNLRAAAPVDDFVFGLAIFNTEGICCSATNTDIEELEADRLEGEAEVGFSIDSLDLTEGTYKLDVAVHKRDGYPYDYHRLLYTFRVRSRHKYVGIFRPRHQWRFSPSIRFKPARTERTIGS